MNRKIKADNFKYRYFLSREILKNSWKPFLILIFGLLVAIISTYYTHQEELSKEAREYQLFCNEIKSKILFRLESCAQVLYDGSAYFSSADTVTREQWKEYINQSRIYDRLQGIQGVGYSVIVPPDRLQRHLQQIHREGYPAYSIRPAGKRDIYTSIIYLEPFSGRNLRAFGYDMFSEPVRRAAMEHSRDQDVATLSGKVILVQETSKDIQEGTLMYVPVYRKNMPHDTPKQRQKAIKGWVYSPYRMADLIQGLLGRWAIQKLEDVHLQIYDERISLKTLLYSSQKADPENLKDIPSRNVVVPINFNGKKWILLFTQSTEQYSAVSGKTLIVLFGGIAMCILVFVLSISLVNTWYKAQYIANELTLELRDSEERVKLLLDSTAEAIYGIDLQGNCTFSNRACHQILGYTSSDELLGKNMHDLIHHSDSNGCKMDVKKCKIYASYIKGLGTHVDDEVLWRKDGTSFPAEYWAFPIIVNNEIKGSVVTFFDITERKRSKDLLDQTRENYDIFFNSIDDFLWVVDPDGKLVHINQTVIQRLGYTQSELIGQSILKVHPEEYRQEAMLIAEEMLEGKTDLSIAPLKTKEGRIIPVETRIISGFWNGKPVTFGVSKDVSKIRLSEEKFSKAFHSNSAMMAITGFISGIYVDVNGIFLKTMGFTQAEIVGANETELSLYQEPDFHTRVIDQLNHRKPVREIETVLRTNSGMRLVVLYSADVIYIADQMCILTVMVDITARKEAEEKILEARKEADEANQAKSEFLSRMSHELRTPMNSILGFAQLLEMGELTPKQEYALSFIRRSGMHLLDLINEVLDISRIEAGKLSLSIEPVHLGSVIREMIDFVRPLASERNIAIEFVENHTAQLYVSSDRQRLKQVILNLLNNAIKYNRQDGFVRIQTLIMKPEADGKIFVKTLITDNGMGIAEEDISKLFKPFERIGAERTETEGTGLGLALIKKLMDAMGGRLGVESKTGSGSTFWIEQILAENQLESIEANTQPTGAQSFISHTSGKILYIEDNLDNVELVKTILLNLRPGINLISDMNGRQAVPLSRKFSPDLILLDLDLPDINGKEVLKMLQKDQVTNKIPVVIISADVFSAHQQPLIENGAKCYLAKPLDINQFLKIVDQYVIE